MHVYLNVKSLTQSEGNVVRKPKFWTLVALKLIYRVLRLHRAMVFK